MKLIHINKFGKHFITKIRILKIHRLKLNDGKFLLKEYYIDHKIIKIRKNKKEKRKKKITGTNRMK